ncbi:hypothetical protein [Pseudomonas putida]|uniref:hypothetical protein n=1 Tax=Pseudomonas putida TaxID=303 RepID=UPI00031876BC|nr:hypothetical protein [Pseudomonas putida]QQE86002.1 hypothetical protein JET17_10160 [Pseudomonas putida]
MSKRRFSQQALSSCRSTSGLTEAPVLPFDVARIQHFVAWEQHEAAALTVEAQM